MKIDEIMTLIQAVSDSTLTSFELVEGDTKICLKREKEKSKIVTVAAPAVDPAVTAQMVSAAAGMAGAVPVPAAAQAPAPAPAGGEEAASENGDAAAGNVVASPLVGTFYAAASPDAEPFVKVGDTVKKGQVLGIIEAMKLMNEIESEYDGTVAEILVENAQGVEYGQPLFRIQ